LTHSGDVPALSLNDVSVAYDDKTVLAHITLAIEPGEFVGVVGPNGAGKSTLLNALLGMVPLRGGQIRIHGLRIAQARSRLSYMPQREAVDWTFPVDVDDVVLMGRQSRLGFGRRPTLKDRDVVTWALTQMQMLAQRHTPIGSLSGGQQQRVFLARALAQEGDVLLLDEPLTGVDAPTQETILRLLQDFQRAGRTVLMTTHDLGVARAFCSKVLFINRVALAYGSPVETFTPAVLQQTYGGHVVRLSGNGTDANALDDALLILRDDAHHHTGSHQGTH
jgi:manganese/zinc/iron transport system ATP- binding protein